jgi:hypothetical protein
MNIWEKRQIDVLTAHGDNAVVGSYLLRRSGQGRLRGSISGWQKTTTTLLLLM